MYVLMWLIRVTGIKWEILGGTNASASLAAGGTSRVVETLVIIIIRQQFVEIFSLILQLSPSSFLPGRHFESLPSG